VSRLHVLRSRTHFRRYRGRRVPLPYFAHSDTFSVVLSASGLVFMFCDPQVVLGGSEGVGCRFHVLRSRTHFGLYIRWSGYVFMCATEFISGGT
jgi:hypothetical protein